MKKAIVVGSGAGGSMVARELQGAFQVTVLEAGEPFRPFAGNLGLIEALRRGPGLILNETQIGALFPAMKTDTAGDGMTLVRGVCQGGTTTICTGNAVRQDHDLKAMGIDLEAEFQALYHEVPVYADHESSWRAATREAFNACRDLGLQPRPTPKMGWRERCTSCGRCVLGCPRGAKWDSRRLLNQAVEAGADVLCGQRVHEVVVEQGHAVGVAASRGRHRQVHRADLVVLAAGGLGTPAILQESGIECQASLFVDPVLCVAAMRPRTLQNREIPMPFIVQGEHFIVSPYFDFLSYFFNPRWKLPAADIFSLMIKLADTNTGTVSSKGVRKALLDIDRARLEEGVRCCRGILRRMGVKDGDVFLGTLNGGHPGGTLPLSEKEARTLHHPRLPENLYVADATLLPNSLGNPPILTILALAKRIGMLCGELAG